MPLGKDEIATNNVQIRDTAVYIGKNSADLELFDIDTDEIIAAENLPTSPGSLEENVGKIALKQRDSLMKYRSSDFKGTRQSMPRDSLIPTKQSEDGSTLVNFDDNYRMSENTVADSSKVLSPLLQAARDGNVNEVKDLIEKPNTDVLRRDPQHGQTALHFAVRGGHLNTIKAICVPAVVRSIINLPDSRRNTPLHLATAKSRRITKFLLEAGAEVDTYNMRNQTPLGVHILTTKKDDPSLTEMLLMHHADPNSNVDQSTVLHVAVDRQMYDIATRLVRHGARLDVKDENGNMVFDKVNRKVLKKLFGKISHPPVWVPNEERSTCMLCSAKFSKIGLGVRRHHCRHCGRICCGECSHLSVESVKFPKGFDRRLKPGARADRTQKRVCKTCYSVFKERDAAAVGQTNPNDNFYGKCIKYQWDQVPGHHNVPAYRNT